MNTRSNFLAVSFILCSILIFTGCAKNAEGLKEDVSDQAVYVGSEKCASCHIGIKEKLAENPHITAFKRIESYNVDLNKDITIYESVKEGQPKSYKLSETEIVGVMSNHYVIGTLEEKYYRVAAVAQENGEWKLEAASTKDINDDGKAEWVFKDYNCGDCHSPGLVVAQEKKFEGLAAGFSCETCHGPGSIHVTTKSKDTIGNGKNSCESCHTASEPNEEGDILIAQNHYGTRGWFDSNHNGEYINCLTCHSAHQVNVQGKILKTKTTTEMCSKCHEREFDIEKIMWVNPTDKYNHFSKDHSFGKYLYDSYGDLTNTKSLEITKPETIRKMKEKMTEQ